MTIYPNCKLSFVLQFSRKCVFASQPRNSNTLNPLPAAEAPPAARWLEIPHADQMTDFIKHAREANDFRAFTLTFSDKTRRVSVVQSSGMWAKAFAPRCRCSPKALGGCRDGKRRNKGETALCGGSESPGWVCALSAPRLGLSAPSFQRYPLLTEQQPMRRPSSHTDICRIGRDARTHRRARAHTHTHIHIHTHTHTARCSLRPPSRQQLRWGREARSVWTKRQAVTGRRLQHPHSKRGKRGWVRGGGWWGVK